MLKIKDNSKLVQEALECATLMHSGQPRIFGGEPYIMHPIAVATLIRKYIAEATELELEELDDLNHSIDGDILIAAGLLHDVLELPNAKPSDLVKKFGFVTTYLVLEVTTNREMKAAVGTKDLYLACKLKHMSNWALLIKLCDRLDNMSDYQVQKPEFRERKTDETEFILNYIEEHMELTAVHKRIIVDIRIMIEKAKAFGASQTLVLKLENESFDN